jgi:hypothetical protein
MDVYSKYFSVIVSASLKFLMGSVIGLALELTWWETMNCTIIGMMLSVITFTFLGRFIQTAWQRLRKSPPKRFSKRSRWAIIVYNRFGIAGIAFLTPLIFTPIVGTLIALSFKIPPLKIIAWMTVFAVIWGLIVSIALYNIPGLQRFL